MIVIDASVAVKWFVPENGSDAALALLSGSEPLCAPDLVCAETMHVLRKKVKAGDVTEEQFTAASIDLPTYFDEIVPSAAVVGEAAQLSSRLDHGFYDCVYLAVAVSAGAKLVTADEVFMTKASRAGFSSAVQSLHETWTDGSSSLSVADDTIESIARLADRVSQTFESLKDAHTSAERMVIVSTSIYRPAFQSPAYRRLEEMLLGFTREERAQIVALGWFGRAYERGSFSNLLQHARAISSADPKDDLAYHVSVMRTVRAGYEKLLSLSETQAHFE